VAQAGFQYPAVFAIWARDDIFAKGLFTQGNLSGVLGIAKRIAARPARRKYP